MKLLKKLFAKLKSKQFVSEIDKFCEEFDQTHPKKSAAQQFEIDKYARIHYLRDHEVAPDKKKIWEGF